MMHAYTQNPAKYMLRRICFAKSCVDCLCWQQAIGPITDSRLATVLRLLKATKLLEQSGAHV